MNTVKYKALIKELKAEIQRSLNLPMQEIELWRCADCDYSVNYDVRASSAMKRLLRNHEPCRPD